MKARCVIEGAGIAILLMAANVFPLLSPSHQLIYHDPYPMGNVIAGLAIDLAVAAAVFAAFLEVLDRYFPEQSSPLWAALLSLLALNVGNFAVYGLSLDGINVPWNTAMREGVLLSVAGVALVFSRYSPRLLWRSVSAARMGLALCGCAILWLLPEMAFTALHTHPSTVYAFNREVPQRRATQTRVVWILLDELSYDQVFDHRQRDVELPYFDELKKTSVVFSDVQPEGYYTERVLPALFLGRAFHNSRSSLDGSLELYDTKLSQWKSFDQQKTIFAEAKRAGWTTGIAGWFNPYCRILQNVLDSCYWEYISPFAQNLSEKKTVLDNAVSLPADFLLSSEANADEDGDSGGGSVKVFTEEYKNMVVEADQLLRDDSIDFAFVHFPVPHPPGIYNRKTHTLGVKGTYLDNLALADVTLKKLMDAISQTKAASRTIVMISSDHSWRTALWRGGPNWTAEEERATNGGQFDPRPMLMIHFPGNGAGEVRGEPFAELDETEFVRAVLKGQIKTQDDLDSWGNRIGNLRVASR